MTHAAILGPAHVELLPTVSRCGLDFEKVHRPRICPCLVGQVPLTNQELCELAVIVFIGDVGRLRAVPGLQITVLGMHTDLFADRTLPVCNSKVGELKVEKELEDLQRALSASEFCTLRGPLTYSSPAAPTFLSRSIERVPKTVSNMV